MLYPNLKAEMARQCVTQRDIAKKLGKSTSTISYWMSDNQFEIGSRDCFMIRDFFFPNASFEYLFSGEPMTLSAGDRV